MRDAARMIQNRGTRLNPPADRERLLRLQTFDLGPHKSSIIEMFSLFDGFMDWDPGSTIELWTIQRFLSENRLALAAPGQIPFAIGDVMLDADLIDLVDEGGVLSVNLRFEGTRIANGVADLLARIGAGTVEM